MYKSIHKGRYIFLNLHHGSFMLRRRTSDLECPGLILRHQVRRSPETALPPPRHHSILLQALHLFYSLNNNSSSFLSSEQPIRLLERQSGLNHAEVWSRFSSGLQAPAHIRQSASEKPGVHIGERAPEGALKILMRHKLTSHLKPRPKVDSPAVLSWCD